MSAPNAGRQSPEPETQTERQAGSTANNPNDLGGAPSEEYAQEASNEQKNKLASNPTHILADAAEEKTSKK